MPARRAYMQDIFDVGVEGSGIEGDAVVVSGTDEQAAFRAKIGLPNTSAYTTSEDGDILTWNTDHGGMVFGSFRSDGTSDFLWAFEAGQSLFVGKLRADLSDARKAEIRTALGIDAPTDELQMYITPHGATSPFTAQFESAAQVGLRQNSTTPAITGYDVGDIINVDGDLYELVDDADEANVHRGVAAQRGANYVGDDLFEWAPTAENIALMRALLPRSAVGAHPPATIFFRFIAANGYELRNIQINENGARDTATHFGYDSPTTGDRIAEIPIGTRFTVWFYTDAALTQPLTINSTDRWELLDERATPVPDASATQRGTISGGQFSRLLDPITVTSPITLTEGTASTKPIVGLDETQLSPLSRGAPQMSHNFVFSNLNRGDWQSPTQNYNIPLTGIVYVEVDTDNEVIPFWTTAETLRAVQPATAGTAITGANDKVKIETGLEWDVFLGRTTGNVLLVGTSPGSATATFTIRVYTIGGTDAMGQTGPMGQQALTNYDRFPTYEATLWTRAAAGTTPVSGVGFDGQRFVNFPAGWSLHPTQLTGTDPLVAEENVWQRPQPGTSGNWTSIRRTLWRGPEFSSVADPTDPATQITATYVDGTSNFWRAFLPGGGDTGWLPIGRTPVWKQLTAQINVDLYARTSSVLQATRTAGISIVDNEFLIKVTMWGPQVHQEVWKGEKVFQGIAIPAPMGTTTVGDGYGMQCNLIWDATSRAYVFDVVGAGEATYNRGIGIRAPFSFNMHWERGATDPLLGGLFSAVRVYNPSSWATANVLNRARIGVQIWYRPVTLGGF